MMHRCEVRSLHHSTKYGFLNCPGGWDATPPLQKIKAMEDDGWEFIGEVNVLRMDLTGWVLSDYVFHKGAPTHATT